MVVTAAGRSNQLLLRSLGLKATLHNHLLLKVNVCKNYAAILITTIYLKMVYYRCPSLYRQGQLEA